MSYWFPEEKGWHVRAEYNALMLLEEEWIAEWEFGIERPWHPASPNRSLPRPGSIEEWAQRQGQRGGLKSEFAPDVDVGDWRHDPIDGDEAADWVANRWLPGSATERMNERWRKRLEHVASCYGPRTPQRGRQPDNPDMRQNVYRAVMVAFLVYEGLLATRTKRRGSGERPSACDIVADNTGMKYKAVAEKVWGDYKRFMPFGGNRPSGVRLSEDQTWSWGLDEDRSGGGVLRNDLMEARGSDGERRREFYERINLNRNDCPNCGQPLPS